ncbi:MAG TPA: cellulase family glycosylhydrolase, partial [Chitinophagales bacterium]|nr:cellulase family glycosylhydrolase [Chitinophagales bacterium]
MLILRNLLKFRIVIALILFGVSLQLLAQKDYVRVDGTIFRDADGRMLMLRGMNYVNKDKANKFLNLTKDEAFVNLKKWGYNTVRMGVNWSGLEPHPGQYDTTYLKDLDTRLEYARQHGIYVILDMHQDLYSIKFGNGAPLWATLDNDLPLYTGGVWSDAYYISPAAQTSFDNFWKNTPAADEIGVQDHYIKTWAMLAERYKEDKNIIGFDVMNEPFIGTSVEQVLGVMLMEMTDALNKINPEKQYSVKEVGGMWIDEQGKNFILQNLTHKDVFVKVLEKMEPIYSHFEKSALMLFYTNFAKAVRKVNTEHILFWEPSVSSNNGIPSSISTVSEAGTQQAYMSHLYDIVLDTELSGEADGNRVEYMFHQLATSREKLNLPTIVGEWGAFYSGSKELMGAAKLMTDGIDSLLFGDFYWSYYKEMGNQILFQKVLLRPYMQAATGKILKQTIQGNTFEISWQEAKKS